MKHSTLIPRQLPANRQVLSNDDNATEMLVFNEQQSPEKYRVLLKNKVWRHHEEIIVIDRQIQEGSSIVESFEAGGFMVVQNRLSVYDTALPVQMNMFLETAKREAKVTITEYVVLKQDIVFSYAIVAEVWSPDVYEPKATAADEQLVKLPSLSLLKLYFSKDEPWACASAGRLTENDSPVISQRIFPAFIIAMKEKLHDIIWDALPLLLRH